MKKLIWDRIVGPSGLCVEVRLAIVLTALVAGASPGWADDDSELTRCLAARSELAERPDDTELATRVRDCTQILDSERLDEGALDGPTKVPLADAVIQGVGKGRDVVEKKIESVVRDAGGGEVQVKIQNPENPMGAKPNAMPFAENGRPRQW